MKQFAVRRLVLTLCTAGSLAISAQIHAAAFQLWEQDGASIGNYHAGFAAWVNDASTAWYNPAGITHFKNQQIVISADPVLTDFKYHGTVAVQGLGNVPMSAIAQGGMFALVPSLHYVAPISDCWGFGFDVNVPFGLKTNYGSSTVLRYAATKTSINVINISPSLAYRITDSFSIGAGFDYQKVDVKFHVYATALDFDNDTKVKNHIHDNGYGFHAGLLYDFTPDMRVGLSYHSQIALHLEGDSIFRGPLADLTNDGHAVISNNAYADIKLPGYTAVSYYGKVVPSVAVMATAIYTNWKTFDVLSLHNAAGLENFEVSREITVNIPQKFKNTWNFSVGLDYYLNPCFTLRAGIGYDETPVQDRYRNVQLPDSDRYVIALGGHYQATPNVGIDVGWSHVFADDEVRVHPPVQVLGDGLVSTNGKVTGGADVFGVQLTWNIC